MKTHGEDEALTSIYLLPISFVGDPAHFPRATPTKTSGIYRWFGRCYLDGDDGTDGFVKSSMPQDLAEREGTSGHLRQIQFIFINLVLEGGVGKGTSLPLATAHAKTCANMGSKYFKERFI